MSEGKRIKRLSEIGEDRPKDVATLRTWLCQKVTLATALLSFK